MGCTSIKDRIEGHGATVDSGGNLHVSPSIASSIVKASKSVLTTGTELAAARTGRRQVEIQNQSATNNVYVLFATGTAAVSDLLLAPGARYSFPPGVSYEGAIQAIAVGGTTTVLVLEFTT